MQTGHDDINISQVDVKKALQKILQNYCDAILKGHFPVESSHYNH